MAPGMDGAASAMAAVAETLPVLGEDRGAWSGTPGPFLLPPKKKVEEAGREGPKLSNVPARSVSGQFLLSTIVEAHYGRGHFPSP